MISLYDHIQELRAELRSAHLSRRERPQSPPSSPTAKSAKSTKIAPLTPRSNSFIRPIPIRKADAHSIFNREPIYLNSTAPRPRKTAPLRAPAATCTGYLLIYVFRVRRCGHQTTTEFATAYRLRGPTRQSHPRLSNRLGEHHRIHRLPVGLTTTDPIAAARARRE